MCAVLAGARSYIAIAEWARDLTPRVRARLGLGRRAPSESTIRPVLQPVDAAELDQLISTWLAARCSLSPPPSVQSPFAASGDRAGRQERTRCPLRLRSAIVSSVRTR